jgi:S-adenosylmethionine:tRNA-ribosyltransferase-isomerase (queuine synthetase)
MANELEKQSVRAIMVALTVGVTDFGALQLRVHARFKALKDAGKVDAELAERMEVVKAYGGTVTDDTMRRNYMARAGALILAAENP